MRITLFSVTIDTPKREREPPFQFPRVFPFPFVKNAGTGFPILSVAVRPFFNRQALSYAVGIRYAQLADVIHCWPMLYAVGTLG